MDSSIVENKGSSYRESIVSSLLYPYPILTWLKLREYKGIKNPAEYSHELMNHPLAVRFEGSLDKPKDMPFVKELSQYLLTKEPDFKLPASFVD